MLLTGREKSDATDRASTFMRETTLLQNRLARRRVCESMRKIQYPPQEKLAR